MWSLIKSQKGLEPHKNRLKLSANVASMHFFFSWNKTSFTLRKPLRIAKIWKFSSDVFKVAELQFSVLKSCWFFDSPTSQEGILFIVGDPVEFYFSGTIMLHGVIHYCPPGPGPIRWSLYSHMVSVCPSGKQKHAINADTKQATTLHGGLVGHKIRKIC